MASPILENILNQPRSLERVVAHQFGEEGRPALLEAASIAAGANRLILSGMGASLFACIPLRYSLGEKGIASEAIETSELLHYGQATLGPGTAVVLVSRSGDTVEVAKILPILKRAGVKVIGVTNESASRLAREAEVTILVNSFPDQLVAIQTYTGTLVTLLLLGEAIRGGFDERWQDRTSSLMESMRVRIDSAVQAIEDLQSFLGRPVNDLYLLGRGASLASVAEGQLLFHEVAKKAAVGMSAAHFRHGPAEVVREGFRAFVFATQSSTADLDVALAADIERMGGRAWVIGEPGWPVAQMPEPFATILEIVPIQAAAVGYAERCGIPPGQFRFCSPVTLSEAGFDAVGSGDKR